MNRSNHATRALAAAVGILAVAAANPAAAQGLSAARGILETFQSEVAGIVPFIAIIGLMCLGLAYALKWIDLKTFVPFGIGCVVVGSAPTIVGMLIPGGG